MKMIYKVSVERCIACGKCELACAFAHGSEGQPSKSRINIHDFETDYELFADGLRRCLLGACRRFDLCLGRVGPAVAEVVPDAAGEEERFLGHDGDPAEL